MRILWTNHALDQPAGTELFTRDLVPELVRRGHGIEIYCTRDGLVAEELRGAGIAVHTDPRTLKEKFDLIHGQHLLETAAALAALPGTPALFFCHGSPRLDWREHPPLHPRNLRLVTTCESLRNAFVAEFGEALPPVGIVRNAFDPAQFPVLPPASTPPKKALFFHNTLTRESDPWIAAQEACRLRSISIEGVGFGFANRTSNPSAALLDADLVFCTGRCALESAASGRPFILLGHEAKGGLATSGDFESLLASNFTRTHSEIPVEPAALAAEIDRIDLQDTARLATLCRESLTTHAAADALEIEYRSLLETHRSTPAADPRAESMALAVDLAIASRQTSADGVLAARARADQSRLESKLASARADRDIATARLKIVEKILTRGLFRRQAWIRIQEEWNALDRR